ncbi:hypothetical protein D0B54_05780 [Solimonas sp. K1W22B-7]|uniref:hypothetical protein n=1 Tax=Solimonas sp. K1W22B-7 TaxID=2303331 RepID=UPI000E33008D|nr:hypothetical protein [Solimonas sp. K1W22B-7]AXQ28217.1 hypothetical protein D0B54_05780 [Solimonas sp. K1W22B-7]
MSIVKQAESLASEPASWLRLLANWGLSLSGSTALMPVETRQCPLRPLLSRLSEENGQGRVRHGGG